MQNTSRIVIEREIYELQANIFKNITRRPTQKKQVSYIVWRRIIKIWSRKVSPVLTTSELINKNCYLPIRQKHNLNQSQNCKIITVYKTENSAICGRVAELRVPNRLRPSARSATLRIVPSSSEAIRY